MCSSQLLLLCGFLIQIQPQALGFAPRSVAHPLLEPSSRSWSTYSSTSSSTILKVGYVPNPANSTASISAFIEEQLGEEDITLLQDCRSEKNLNRDSIEALQQLHPWSATTSASENESFSESSSSTTTSSSAFSFPQLSDLWTARLLLVGAAALYGTNFSLVKLLGDNMPVGISSTLRFGLASLATMPWLLRGLSPQTAGAALMGFEVGLWNSVGYVAQAIGLETTAASESAFICSLAVVTVPLLEFASGKKLLSREWIGAILAVVGVAILELGGANSSHQLTTGDLCSLVQPLAFGVGFWRMDRGMKAFPKEAARSTAGQLFAIFLASGAYCAWSTGEPSSFPWHDWITNPALLFSLFWTGVITTALTIYMETKALKTLSAAETTLIFSTEPLWGTAFASVVMGEQLGMNAAVGGLLILFGCVFSNLGMNGIRKLMNGETSDKNDGPSSQTQTKKQLGDAKALPQQLQEQWLWLTSSLAASIATWSLAVEEEVPKLSELKDVVLELVDDLGDKLD